MSTKCSILSGEGYHFYYDYKDCKNHIDYDSSEGAMNFLNRVAEILGGCPFSDTGLYMIDLKDPSKGGKWVSTPQINCSKLERARLKAGQETRMYLCGGCNRMILNDIACAFCEFEKKIVDMKKTNALKEKLDKTPLAGDPVRLDYTKEELLDELENMPETSEEDEKLLDEALKVDRKKKGV